MLQTDIIDHPLKSSYTLNPRSDTANYRLGWQGYYVGNLKFKWLFFNLKFKICSIKAVTTEHLLTISDKLSPKVVMGFKFVKYFLNTANWLTLMRCEGHLQVLGFASNCSIAGLALLLMMVMVGDNNLVTRLWSAATCLSGWGGAGVNNSAQTTGHITHYVIRHGTDR